MSQLRNPQHNFGYINLPEVIDVEYKDDKESICWSPFALIEREIFKSEVDVMIKLPDYPLSFYLGKATVLKTGVKQRYLRIDTTECPEELFKLVRDFVECHRPVYQHRPFLVSMHIDSFIKDVTLTASTLFDDDSGLAKDTVLNMITIKLG